MRKVETEGSSLLSGGGGGEGREEEGERWKREGKEGESSDVIYQLILFKERTDSSYEDQLFPHQVSYIPLLKFRYEEEEVVKVKLEVVLSFLLLSSALISSSSSVRLFPFPLLSSLVLSSLVLLLFCIFPSR